MIWNTFSVVLAVSILSKTRAIFTPDCECKGKATANLDLAIQMINNVRDNYATCCSTWLPMDCEDRLRNGQNKSGIYDVWPRSRAIKGPVKVYCDMDTDGGGWTVIQRRGNYLRPIDFFYQDWKSYKEGFGNIDKDFWLGNDNIFGLSNQRLYSVRFDLMDVEGNRGYALYDTFWIDGEEQQYTLHIDGFSGDAGDSMITMHNGKKFTAKDGRNDKKPGSPCAETYKGAWWYGGKDACHTSNLNGLYHRGKHESFADGINWSSWKGFHESLESTEIKIRSKDFRK